MCFMYTQDSSSSRLQSDGSSNPTIVTLQPKQAVHRLLVWTLKSLKLAPHVHIQVTQHFRNNGNVVHKWSTHHLQDTEGA